MSTCECCSELLNARRQRYEAIDLIKGISCIAVVLIHYNFKGTVGDEVRAACRFAVPVFFMISGYFLHPYDGSCVHTDAIMRKVLKLTKVLIVSTLCYWVLMWLITPRATFLGKYLSAAALAKFAITNDGLFNAGLWFIGALIYCYFLIALFCKRELALRFMLSLAVPTLVMMCVTQEFARVVGFKWNYLQLCGSEPRAVICLSAVFAFRALPFFLIGSWLRLKSSALKRVGVADWVLCTTAVAGSGLAVAEYHLLGNRLAQFYLGSYVTALVLMLWAIRKDACEMRCGKTLVWIGSELSMLIYLTHVGVGKVVDVMAGNFHWWGNPIYNATRCLMVLSGTFAVSFLIRFLIRLIGGIGRTVTR